LVAATKRIIVASLVFTLFARRLYPIPADNVTQHLSILSVIIGLTAWHGVNKVLRPAAGEVLVVSGGAGAVGSLVGQLGKLKGAKVIGIAGSAAKCKLMKEEVRKSSPRHHPFFLSLTTFPQFTARLRPCHQLQN
jgi:NADPH-dependent curcumin reductase CurA